MGVPSLFRWFDKKFPGVVRRPEPQNDECDNLYIDANSVIHNVCHPAHRLPPPDEESMMVEIGAYLDHIIKTAKPKKLVMIAIDGVAPQAKILQQRARRFRAAKDADEEKQKKAAFLELAKKEGITKYNGTASYDNWDSNAITPGTPFMAKLDAWLHSWLLRKLRTDPQLFGLTFILSGSACPGEGEHKAMDFIRRQRAQPGYNPLKHAFYGPDADLILLALATHEPCFRILREDPREKTDHRCTICQGFHPSRICPGIPEDWTSLPTTEERKEFTPPRLVFFDVWLLRIALETYLKLPDLITPITIDGEKQWDSQKFFHLERAIDDFIMLIALMGNDFIPGLPMPKWEINEGAINLVVDEWKRTVLAEKGYITKNGKIRMDRLRALFKALIHLEGFPPDATEIPARLTSEAPKKDSATPGLRDSSVASSIRDPTSKLFVHLSSTNPLAPRSNGWPDLPEGMGKLSEKDQPKSAQKKEGLFEEYVDFFEEYELFPTKSSYYEAKLGKAVGSKPETIRHMVKSYAEGLQWVMLYYCQGCPDWKWYYPYHYAPWPSDTAGLSRLEVVFDQKSSPLPPFSQLMSVFPPRSADHVPKPYRQFMLDPKSPLKDFYPLDFEVDPNGKKQEWKAVVLLAHINARRLQEVLQPVWHNEALWDKDERQRNKMDYSRVIVADQQETKPLFDKLHSMHGDPRKKGQVVELKIETGNALAGAVLKDDKLDKAEAANKDFLQSENAVKVRTVSAIYTVPKAKKEHSCELLPNQPKHNINYKLVARMKRDPTKTSHRVWPSGDNAGRDARAVAAELEREKQTGVKAQFHNWFETFENLGNDDTEMEVRTDLPSGFDSFLAPSYPEENGAIVAMAAINLGEEEDEDARDLEMEDGEVRENRSSTAPSNPFKQTSLPSKRPHPPAPAAPARTAAGYTKIVEPVKVESDYYDSDDSDRPKKAKTKFKKNKNASARHQAQVKREPDDDMDWR